MSKKTMQDVALAGKRVLIRVDFNVPRSKTTRRPVSHRLPATV